MERNLGFLILNEGNIKYFEEGGIGKASQERFEILKIQSLLGDYNSNLSHSWLVRPYEQDIDLFDMKSTRASKTIESQELTCNSFEREQQKTDTCFALTGIPWTVEEECGKGYHNHCHEHKTPSMTGTQIKSKCNSSQNEITTTIYELDSTEKRHTHVENFYPHTESTPENWNTLNQFLPSPNYLEVPGYFQEQTPILVNGNETKNVQYPLTKNPSVSGTIFKVMEPKVLNQFLNQTDTSTKLFSSQRSGSIRPPYLDFYAKEDHISAEGGQKAQLAQSQDFKKETLIEELLKIREYLHKRKFKKYSGRKRHPNLSDLQNELKNVVELSAKTVSIVQYLCLEKSLLQSRKNSQTHQLPVIKEDHFSSTLWKSEGRT